MELYDVNLGQHSNPYFELHDARTYFLNNKEHESVPHRHNFYQIIWFKESGRHFIDYQTVYHKPNTLFFINRNQIHYFCLDARNEGTLFHFDDFFIDSGGGQPMDRFALSVFNEIGSSDIELSAIDTNKIRLLTSFIESELMNKDPYFKEQVYHYFLNILYQIERIRRIHGGIDALSNAEHKLALEFKNMVFEEISHFHAIGLYAKALGTNTKTLTTISKKVLLETPANLIRNSKILVAKRMLANKSKSIKEVAYSLGFEDPTYFTKYFSRGTGFTPKQFRKAYL